MKSITFFDLEIDANSHGIADIGGIKSNGETFHSTSIRDFLDFLDGTGYVCGHNIFKHDLKYMEKVMPEINSFNRVDTLYFSPLLFPAQPYHNLVKDDKLDPENYNNPLNDSQKAKRLFHDEENAFRQLDEELKQIYYLLLSDIEEFSAFFRYMDYSASSLKVETLIRQKFNGEVCDKADFECFVHQYPVELAYCLALIHARNRYSITPRWVLKNYPGVENVMHLLRGNPCLTGCSYCRRSLDIHVALKRYFNFDSYRKYAEEALQENAVKAAVTNKSILAIFPTGGGKSLTFQVPALMAGENMKALTIVISPLQSLMKDQVDNLEKSGITDAVTINGLLDPIERAKSIERVENGSACVLYIAPESLRSKTIERLLLGRKIARFVIDEAHCFSVWGQDFRPDYMYIADFIKLIQEEKQLNEPIPISCFTATAKQKVIGDIKAYFKDRLSVELELFAANTSRTNLHYEVYNNGSDEEKYNVLRNLLESKDCPVIVYTSRTHRAAMLAEQLREDGFDARAYHGKMDVKQKKENQDAFMAGEVRIIVATSAFGMGVDKKDVGMVIHYEISDSLENYVQEAGRAGRDENITADCYVLFNEQDLDKHFTLLNQTRLNQKEIQQIWKAIKNLTGFRSKISNSAIEIARKAGWDDNLNEIETRVKSAIAALEEAGYLKRGQNTPRVFANSILTRNAEEAITKIRKSFRFDDKQKEYATRIIKKLFSTRSRRHTNDEIAESRVDYISDHLGIAREDVIHIINLMREEQILSDAKDLTAFIKKGEKCNRSLSILETYCKVENYLQSVLNEEGNTYNLKELNEGRSGGQDKNVTLDKIKTIINFWDIQKWLNRKRYDSSNYSKNHVVLALKQPKEKIEEWLEKRQQLAKFILEYIYEKNKKIILESSNDEVLIEFSVLELKNAYEKQQALFKVNVGLADVENALFYLSRIEAIKIEGGFLVVYNKLTIERLEKNNYKQYTSNDYGKLDQFYKNKTEQIHIVGEYAKKMISGYKEALQFVDDYFRLNHTSFLNKYFSSSRQKELARNITPSKFQQLFGELSIEQLKIIRDNKSKYIVVAAGPGSGKTRVLVHKLASLLLMEDVKHEQLLMLTFSRAAATEFKKRLIKLIGNAASFVEIKTFHSFCFDLLGFVGDLEKSKNIIRVAIEKISSREVELCKITKTVLVIDEAQDMDKDEFALVKALMGFNEEMRVIAVGDDDQNIYEFRDRDADSKYLEKLITENDAIKYELIENYRSKNNLVLFSNEFVRCIQGRLKKEPIVAVQRDNGKIKITYYNNTNNLIVPLVEEVYGTGLMGTTCVLTKKNEDAAQIAGLLLRKGLRAKLIQSNDQFNLYDLQEIRYFVGQFHSEFYAPKISDEKWKYAKLELQKMYGKSSKIEIVNRLLKDFEETNKSGRYKSDLELFIRESKLEDFLEQDGETIFVSTMHKAKGREFDNVFLHLEGFPFSSDEEKRLLYVAMTRAKQNLYIHSNWSYWNHVNMEIAEKIVNSNDYGEPDELCLHLGHTDVWLGYFIYKQQYIDGLTSGDELVFEGDTCFTRQKQPVLKFSKDFWKKLKILQQKGYMFKTIKVNFIVYWRCDENKEIKIILPELILRKLSK